MSRKGFTLIEIMIVVIILGIMAAFAMPSMSKTKEKAVVGEAKQLLSIYRAAQVRHYLERNAYATNCNNLDVEPVDGSNFSVPTCYSTADKVASVSRDGISGYVVTVSANGVFSCEGANCPSHVVF